MTSLQSLRRCLSMAADWIRSRNPVCRGWMPEGSAKQLRSLQQLLSQFWKRWSSDYVASLQPRSEWRHERADLSVDDVGLITDDGIPPLLWSIGLVMQLNLGHDGLARVALVRTSRAR